MSDKFVSPSPPPEGLERELLTILAEESAEVAQRCTKALRFGSMEVQPGQGMTNAERIAQEVGDMVCVIKEIEKLGLFDWYDVLYYSAEKEPKLQRFLQSTPPEPPETNND